MDMFFHVFFNAILSLLSFVRSIISRQNHAFLTFLVHRPRIEFVYTQFYMCASIIIITTQCIYIFLLSTSSEEGSHTYVLHTHHCVRTEDKESRGKKIENYNEKTQ